MKVIYRDGALHQTLENGQVVTRDTACDVPDEIAERLVDRGDFERYVDERPATRAPRTKDRKKED